MKARSTLSIAPYFGGKARMAHFIADRLDYANSDIFVTPFGGMCRVLLNKPSVPSYSYIAKQKSADYWKEMAG